MRRTLFTLSAGPVEVYPEVREALTRPVLADTDPAFLALYERVAEKVTRAMRAETPALILQSEAILGIEAAAASLIGPEDVVLNLVSGPFGKGFGYWAARHAKEVIELAVPYDTAIEPAAVREALERRPDIAVVALVHHETPVGTLNPAAEIAAIARDAGVLTIIDAVSSFAGMPVHADAGDVFIAGPGKCLGGVPGLTFVAVSEPAWAHIEANPTAPFASILSLKDWRDAHRADRPFPFTPLIAEINALDATMDRYLAEGATRVWARHARTARACRRGVAAMGLALWPRDETIAAPTVTAVRMPEGIDGEAVVAEARRRYGVVLAGAGGDLAGRLVRIGHMGPTAEPIYAVVALAALGGALRAEGFAADVAAGMEAARLAADDDDDDDESTGEQA